MHFWAAQIEITMLKPQILPGQILLARGKRRRRRFVEQFQLRRPQLNLPGVDFRIFLTLGPIRHGSGDSDHVFGTELLGQLNEFRAAVGIDDNLRKSVPVAEVEKNAPAVVAICVDPSAECGFVSGVIYP